MFFLQRRRIMKIVVMSDSHGSAGAVFRVIRKHTDADLFIHL